MAKKKRTKKDEAEAIFAIRRKTMKLPVKFSDTEYRETTERLLDHLTRRQELLDKVESAKARAKGIAGLNKEYIEQEERDIYQLQVSLKHNTHPGDTEVYEIYDREKEVVFVRRADTKEIVPAQFRRMSQEELETLPLSDIDDQQLVEQLLPSVQDWSECENALKEKEQGKPGAVESETKTGDCETKRGENGTQAEEHEAGKKEEAGADEPVSE
jgi:chorismate mutase